MKERGKDKETRWWEMPGWLDIKPVNDPATMSQISGIPRMCGMFWKSMDGTFPYFLRLKKTFLELAHPRSSFIQSWI